jgi:hypothetical protein
MFRNSISEKITSSVVRKTTSVGLLVAGVAATSPLLRAYTTCTAAEWDYCLNFCNGYADSYWVYCIVSADPPYWACGCT